ncbi:MAG: NAD-dependent epimerase/dehydratase family protein [Gemmatimonadales bacterium]
MRVLAVGGTGFIGAPLVRRLHAAGHEVTVYHRGLHDPDLPEGVRRVRSESAGIPVTGYPEAIRRVTWDVIVHLTLLGAGDAAAAVAAFRGRAGRLVVVSSGDVYAAYGGLLGLEVVGDLGETLSEDAALRSVLYPYGRRVPEGPWGELIDYEKILAERIAGAAPDLPATILRLPAVYGPGGRQHRFYPWIRRMDEGREVILLSESQAGFRFTHGYVDNVAAAIACAATHPAASHRVFNLGEAETPTGAERVRALGRSAGWRGRVVVVPDPKLPEHLGDSLHYVTDLALDTRRIRTELGYHEPIPADAALRRTVDWERANPPLSVDPARFNYAAEDAALSAP